jgi:hypothetical protein
MLWNCSAVVELNIWCIAQAIQDCWVVLSHLVTHTSQGVASDQAQSTVDLDLLVVSLHSCCLCLKVACCQGSAGLSPR